MRGQRSREVRLTLREVEPLWVLNRGGMTCDLGLASLFRAPCGEWVTGEKGWGCREGRNDRLGPGWHQ